jgi:hypothetical protein
MTLFDASQFGVDAGFVTLATSAKGSIQASDSPSGPAQHVSLWQSDSVAIKANREEFGYLRGRDTAVATMAGVQYDDQPSGV